MEIKIYSDIVDNYETLMYEYCTGSKPVTARSIKNVLDANKDDDEIELSIHCNGGSVAEAFTAYDLLRTSGKNIKANIDGSCHSAAIILLLAAPAEKRTANKNATALIHDVTGYLGMVTAKEAKEAAKYLEEQREKILNLYTERTGQSLDKLRNIMLEEEERTAEELKTLGFINQINPYTTNMKKTLTEVCNSIKNYFKGAKNFSHTDADGNELFATETEDPALEVGMSASPDGTYMLPADGGGEIEVTIKDSVITEIIVPESADETSIESVIAENAKLKTENKKMENLLKDAQVILEANNSTRSVTKIMPKINSKNGEKNEGSKKATVKESKQYTGQRK